MFQEVRARDTGNRIR